MKKVMLTALAALFGGAVLAPMAATASDGQITFSGNVNASTCTIASSANGTTGTANFAVALPTVSKASLGAAAGVTAGTTPFSLSLTNCPAGTNTVAANFDASAAINTNGRLNNTNSGAGAATGVDLQVLNNSQAAINLNTQANATTAAVTGGNATLNYFVQYYNNGGTLGAGTVASAVNYSITYK
ncbi:fimbrial protein [Dyella silvae]|uniref:fimbrial protein n=1 Tax=Dyella silvae TaxID=2994424 RepID=UPI002264CFB5|nr:fimbrial protein [Dyella silvae]